MALSRNAPPRSVGSNTFANAAWALAPLAAAVASIPATVHAFGIERYGIIALGQLALAHTGLLDFGLGRATVRFVARHNHAGRHRYAALTVWVSAIFSLLIGASASLGLALLVTWKGAGLFRVDPLYGGEMLVALYAIAAMVPMATLTGTLTGGLEGMRKFGLINALQSPMLVLGQVVPLMVAPFGVDAGLAVVSIAATRLALMIAVLIVCGKYFPWRSFRRVAFRRVRQQIVTFSRWIAVSNLVNPLLVSADRLVLGAFMSVGTMGIYTIPYNLVTRMWLLPSALTRTLFPEFGSRRTTDPQGWELCLNCARYLTLLLCLAAVPVVGVGPEAMRIWLGTQIGAPTGGLLQILTLGVLANSLGQVYGTFLQGSGRPAITARLHLFELPIYIPALVFLVIRFGATGAACAWSGRMIIDAALVYRASVGTLKGGRSPRSERLLWRALLIGGAALACAYTASVLFNPLWQVALSSGFIAVALGASCWRFGLNESERVVLAKETVRIFDRRSNSMIGAARK